ncbi:MAG: hypothetical protein H7301_00930 [Cryobacterium sp.]|nr:hypothetical protein [Oligoflexia bacterium]
MSVSIVWLNQQHAKAYHFSDQRMFREALTVGKTSESLHLEIAERIKDSSKVLLLSPDRSAEAFADFLRNLFPKLAQKIVGIETLAVASDEGIGNFASHYFQKPVGRNAP